MTAHVETIIGQLYVGLLGRPVDAEGLIAYRNMIAGGKDFTDVCRSLVTSDEFRSKIAESKQDSAVKTSGCTRSELGLLSKYEQKDRTSRLGFITDFMGNVTSPRVYAPLEKLSGHVEGLPIPGNFHGECLEWLGTLKSVEEASLESYTLIELGAGWAPWCAIGYRAAKTRGISNISLTAVEGDAGHVEFINKHILENKIPGECISVFDGVVGPEDGYADFPRHINSSIDYGGAAAFGAQDTSDLDYFKAVSGFNIASVDRTQCVSISTLAKDYKIVDLIHCDIQGAEEVVMRASMETLNEKVKRIVLGTHSNQIDRNMIDLFGSSGWHCEGVFATEVDEASGMPVVTKDGCQVWKNRGIS